MNEFSPLCLAVIAQAVEDLGAGNGFKNDAKRFLMDEDDLFFFIDAGQLEIKTGQLRREMTDKRLNRKWVRHLKRMRQAAL